MAEPLQHVIGLKDSHIALLTEERDRLREERDLLRNGIEHLLNGLEVEELYDQRLWSLPSNLRALLAAAGDTGAAT